MSGDTEIRFVEADIFRSIKWRIVHEPRMWVSKWVGDVADSWKPFAIRLTPHFCTGDGKTVRSYSVRFFHENAGCLNDHYLGFSGETSLSRVSREAVLKLWEIIDSNTIKVVGDDFMQEALGELNNVVGVDSRRSLLFDLGCAFVESARLDNLRQEMEMADQEYVPHDAKKALLKALEVNDSHMDAMREHILEQIPEHISDVKYSIEPSQYREEICPAWIDL